MHGLGNDFMVIDATTRPFNLTVEQIQAVADRRRGVGFDQLLVLSPSTHPEADFDYLIFNQDGSAAEQCGNGARCMAKYIQYYGLSQKNELNLHTAGKITKVRVESDGNVTVEICEPYFEPARIPFKTQQDHAPYHLEIAGKAIEFYVAGLGNPHAVIITQELDPNLIEILGKNISVHPSFPQRVNVGFMKILDSAHIQLQVYERGAGLTLACGSGACAAAAVGRFLGLLDESVWVDQPGGQLLISWSGVGFPLKMCGPAIFVYQGSLFLTESWDTIRGLLSEGGE